MTPNCAYCIHSGILENHMYTCSILGHGVVADRPNKKFCKREICRAEELGKGAFKIDKEKYKSSQIDCSF